MMNPLAFERSVTTLPQQIEIVKRRLPYIAEIYKVDEKANMKTDYMENVDAYAISNDARHYNIQFKVRNEGNNDFVLIAKKISGKAVMTNDIGFMYHNKKYTFELKSADIYVETLGNGETYILTREEINSLERCPLLGLAEAITGIQPKYVYADDGSKIDTGDFYVFISSKQINLLKSAILNASLA